MKTVWAVALSWMMVALSGCAGGDEATEIEMDDNYFKPDEATAKAGDQFQFENKGARDHTITIHRPPAAATQYYSDQIVKPGEKAVVTFDQAGTYHVFCKYHGAIGSGMHLNVTVSA